MKRYTLILALVAFMLASVSAYAETLQQKIGRLGISETTATVLAQKIERKQFTPVEIGSPIVPKKFIWGNKIDDKPRTWSGSFKFRGERYTEGGIVLHRFMNNGTEVLYTPASGDNSVVVTVVGGRSLDPTLSLRPKKTGEGLEIVHEPEAGVLAGANHQGEWLGGYIRYKANLDDGSNVIPGIGFIGEGSHSRYQGGTTTDAGAIGPMAGVKVLGETSMAEMDIALQYYFVEKYKKSDKQFTKEGIRLYGRVDGQKKITEYFILGGVVDGYYDLNQQVENRSAISGGVYAFVKINDEWQWRPYIGVSHKFWSDITEGKIIPLEFRYKGRWKFGIGMMIPFNGNPMTPFGLVAYSAGPALKEKKAENDRNGRIAHIPDDQRVE